ncbi:putative hydrolase of the HAD superfamily [Mucilaginibacter mallensis]|uniref:Putative hydrolase of the HAD superfamily n=1 Tax=Mucilaginibacter mallensis TaxID=652787 RepID=A0A1H1SYL9_MUCMA|nr:HAD family phosphatase [Mucilaginibacter mallensis]SDS52499.1 putative hydrolase of the HAD superfamily [Mucilaginibacter mallensis]
MQNIKNIIFDYGNVIFNINFAQVQDAWKKLGINNADDFYGHRHQDPVFNLLERGEISPAGFRARIRELTNKPGLTDEQIDDAWNAIFVGIPQGNHELLLKLKDKYRTFLLSNINAIHYDYVHRYLKDEFGMNNNEGLFEKTYYSHLTGKRKPEPEIFEQVLNENNLNPAETLFIDDSPQHLETAKKLGIQTFLMTAPDTIQKFFEREKLV